MDSRTKAKEYLLQKGIPDPEVIAAHLDEIGLDKIDRLATGDCYKELVSLGVANKIETAAADSCLSLNKIV